MRNVTLISSFLKKKKTNEEGAEKETLVEKEHTVFPCTSALHALYICTDFKRVQLEVSSTARVVSFYYLFLSF